MFQIETVACQIRSRVEEEKGETRDERARMVIEDKCLKLNFISLAPNMEIFPNFINKWFRAGIARLSVYERPFSLVQSMM